MYDIKQFRPALYLLVILGVSGFALAAQAPGIWVLAMVAILVNGWLVKTGVFRPMPRLVANAVTILAFVYVAMQVQQLGPRSVLVIGQFLVLLQLIKLYEQRANRDYAQLIVLSLLLMVAAAINTAELVFGLMFIAYLFLSLYCCLLFHLKVETDQAREAIATPNDKLNPATLRQDQRYLSSSMRRLTTFVSVVAVAMAVVVFLAFPRGTGAGMLSPLQFRQNQTLTGFSEQVDFQRVASITQNEQVVAHVKLWKNDQPIRGEMTLLLRGVTLDRYSGKGDERRPPWRWSRRPSESPMREVPAGAEVRLGPQPAGGDLWRQAITLQPTGTNVLFAIPGIVSFKPERHANIVHSRHDEAIRSMDRLENRISYEAVSRGALVAQTLEEEEQLLRAYRDNWISQFGGGGGRDGAGDAEAMWQERLRRRESQIDDQVRAYARRPEVSGRNAAGPLAEQRGGARVSPLDGEIAATIEKHLQTQFSYTLDLTDAKRIEGQDPLVSFLYDLKRGHCEYFAGAMTLMCQSLGMQARMVVGFKCDEYNATGDWYIVRQSHAHAWVEVRMPDNTWRTYDPTSGQDPRDGMRQANLWTKMKHVFDFLEYTWAANVVAYDRDTRENVMTQVDRQLVSTAANSKNLIGNFHSYLYDAGLWLASRFVGPLMALMVLVMIGSIVWFLIEKWRLRRRAERIGLDALPEREKLRLARQLGFYDDLLRLLERRHISRPQHLTPMEFSDSLAFLPTESYQTVRRLTELFYRIRFGGAELSPGRQHLLHRVIDRLDRAMS